jgi:hypothetical protein
MATIYGDQFHGTVAGQFSTHQKLAMIQICPFFLIELASETEKSTYDILVPNETFIESGNVFGGCATKPM